MKVASIEGLFGETLKYEVLGRLCPDTENAFSWDDCPYVMHHLGTAKGIEIISQKRVYEIEEVNDGIKY